jgi:hypothetical protein
MQTGRQKSAKVAHGKDSRGKDSQRSDQTGYEIRNEILDSSAERSDSRAIRASRARDRDRKNRSSTAGTLDENSVREISFRAFAARQPHENSRRLVVSSATLPQPRRVQRGQSNLTRFDPKLISLVVGMPSACGKYRRLCFLPFRVVHASRQNYSSVSPRIE